MTHKKINILREMKLKHFLSSVGKSTFHYSVAKNIKHCTTLIRSAAIEIKSMIIMMTSGEKLSCVADIIN